MFSSDFSSARDSRVPRIHHFYLLRKIQSYQSLIGVYAFQRCEKNRTRMYLCTYLRRARQKMRTAALPDNIAQIRN